MQRRLLVRHIIQNSCIFVREGAKHSVFWNPLTRRSSTVPRHNEVDYHLAIKICRDLGIADPAAKIKKRPARGESRGGRF